MRALFFVLLCGCGEFRSVFYPPDASAVDAGIDGKNADRGMLPPCMTACGGCQIPAVCVDPASGHAPNGCPDVCRD